MADSTGRRRTSVGVLFWIAFILLVLVIFLANRGNIEQVLETTGIVDVIRDRVSRDDVPGPAPESTTEDPPTTTVVESELPAAPEVRTEPERIVTTERAPDEAGGDTAEPEVQAPASDAPRADDVETASRPLPNRRMAALYYVRVTDDGKTHAHRVVRPVDYDQSPLTATLRELIAGPTGEELDAGLLNLIPADTQLISAYVENGIAYLSFNQAFRFNQMGAEGTVAQLQQIIYSSTEFSTVEKVQFLIDGEKLDYVGGDGIYIGAPLGRDAFSS